jgi:hypothetical protein
MMKTNLENFTLMWCKPKPNSTFVRLEIGTEWTEEKLAMIIKNTKDPGGRKCAFNLLGLLLKEYIAEEQAKKDKEEAPVESVALQG